MFHKRFIVTKVENTSNFTVVKQNMKPIIILVFRSKVLGDMNKYLLSK